MVVITLSNPGVVYHVCPMDTGYGCHILRHSFVHSIQPAGYAGMPPLEPLVLRLSSLRERLLSVRAANATSRTRDVNCKVLIFAMMRDNSRPSSFLKASFPIGAVCIRHPRDEEGTQIFKLPGYLDVE